MGCMCGGRRDARAVRCRGAMCVGAAPEFRAGLVTVSAGPEGRGAGKGGWRGSGGGCGVWGRPASQRECRGVDGEDDGGCVLLVVACYQRKRERTLYDVYTGEYLDVSSPYSICWSENALVH